MSWIRAKCIQLLLWLWPLLLGCLRYSILSIRMMSLIHSMTLCHILLSLLSSGVLILGSLLTSWPRFVISFSRFLAILSSPSLTCTLFLSRDVHFYMPLSQMLLWVFHTFSFVPWLWFIGVVLLLMLFSFWFLFIGFYCI